MGTNNYGKEIPVNLSNVIFYLMRKWRSVLAAMAVGILLGGGLYLGRNALQQGAAPETQNGFSTENYAVNEEMRASMEVAHQYRVLFESQLEYNKNSLLMQMDPGSVWRGGIEYYISDKANTELLVENYMNIFNDDEMMQTMADAAGIECEPKYLREVTETSYHYGAGISASDNSFSIAGDDRLAVIGFSVSQIDEDACRQMLQVIRQEIEGLNQELQEKYGAYYFEEIGESVRLVVDDEYQTKQKANADKLQDYKTKVDAYEDALDENSLQYYESVYLGQKTAESSAADFSVSGLLKGGIAGMFAVCIIWCIILVIIYLTDGRVKEAEELKSVFGLNVLGHIEGNPEVKKGIDKWIASLYRHICASFNTVEFVGEAVNLLCLDKAILCLDEKSKEAERLSEKLLQVCSGLEKKEYYQNETELLTAAKGSGGVVLVIETMHTFRSDIVKITEACKLQNIKLLGAVVIAG